MTASDKSASDGRASGGYIPGKHPAMISHSGDPLNLETPLGLLADSSRTPNELFYVRNHGNIPAVDAGEYRIRVGGLVDEPLELSLAQLRERFEPRTVEAALHCAGNRREELAAVAPIPGELPWGSGAIGNARWGGVSLAEVLGTAGVRDGAHHVAFTGLDEVYEGESPNFGGSIPLQQALSPEVLLVFEMNSEPLPAEHGFPLRVVVPGYVGARSVKWLASISVQEHPSENHFQRTSYRLFPPHVTDEAAADEGLPLGEVSVNTVVLNPRPDDRLPAGRVTIRGVAITGGGRSIERVEVTTDGGRNWTGARLPDLRSPGAWQPWEAELDLAPGTHHVAARAVDSAANTQPESAASLWNVKGYVNNAWYSVRLKTY